MSWKFKVQEWKLSPIFNQQNIYYSRFRYRHQYNVACSYLISKKKDLIHMCIEKRTIEQQLNIYTIIGCTPRACNLIHMMKKTDEKFRFSHDRTVSCTQLPYKIFRREKKMKVFLVSISTVLSKNTLQTHYSICDFFFF